MLRDEEVSCYLKTKCLTYVKGFPIDQRLTPIIFEMYLVAVQY